MRILGISALIVAVLSFFLWLFSWSYWNVFVSTAGGGSAVRYIAQTCSFLSSLGELLAIVLLSIGLVFAGKRTPANDV